MFGAAWNVSSSAECRLVLASSRGISVFWGAMHAAVVAFICLFVTMDEVVGVFVDGASEMQSLCCAVVVGEGGILGDVWNEVSGLLALRCFLDAFVASQRR